MVKTIMVVDDNRDLTYTVRNVRFGVYCCLCLWRRKLSSMVEREPSSGSNLTGYYDAWDEWLGNL